MGNEEGLDKLFFELASESRLSILWALQNGELRMQELARELDLTDTETCRQLQRLSETQIVQKQTDGKYALSNYAKLLLELNPAFEVAFRHKEYFAMHDFCRLPHSFICRLGDFMKATLSFELAGNINRLEDMINTSNEYIWSMTDQHAAVHSKATAKRIQEGIRFRSLIHERLIGTPMVKVTDGKGVEKRSLPNVPAIVVVTDKEALVSLFLLDGKTEFAAFIGSDPLFRGWAEDIFNYCWNQGKRII